MPSGKKEDDDRKAGDAGDDTQKATNTATHRQHKESDEREALQQRASEHAIIHEEELRDRLRKEEEGLRNEKISSRWPQQQQPPNSSSSTRQEAEILKARGASVDFVRNAHQQQQQQQHQTPNPLSQYEDETKHLKEASFRTPSQNSLTRRENKTLQSNATSFDPLQNSLTRHENDILQSKAVTIKPSENSNEDQPPSGMDDILDAKVSQIILDSRREAQAQPGAYAQAAPTSTNSGPTIVRSTSSDPTNNSDSHINNDHVNNGSNRSDEEMAADSIDTERFYAEDKELVKDYSSTACIALLFLFLLTVIIVTTILFLNPGDIFAENNNDVLIAEQRNKRRFIQSLPISTQQAILDPTTPQAQALSVLNFVDTDSDADNESLSWKQTQRFAMAVLYYSFFGRLPSMEQDDCEWLGQFTACERETKKYEKLNIQLSESGNSTLIRLPPEIGLLTNLIQIEISSATSTDPEESYYRAIDIWLPRELSKLQQLKQLDFIQLRLKGTVPTFIGDMTGLEKMDWSFNDLTGTVPSEVGSLKNLELLSLNNNQLSGSLPSELFGENLGFLSHLWLNDNQITGTIATEISTLSNLHYLSFGQNRLVGTIPSEIGLNRKLIEVKLHRNLLTGSLPSEIVDLEKLRLLDVRNNSITGTVPTLLCTPSGSRLMVYADCNEIVCCGESTGGGEDVTADINND